MGWWLRTQRKFLFDTPESFIEYDAEKDCCREKLSEDLIESSVQDEVDRDKARFSKGVHTPLLLMAIDPNEVQKNVRYFANSITISISFVVLLSLFSR